MATRALIEVRRLNSEGTVQSSTYHQVSQWPVRIGRALDNDLVLTDPHVAPHHLSIEESLRLNVHSTLNGVTVQDSKLGADSTTNIIAGSPIRLGLTELILIDEAYALQPEQALAVTSIGKKKKTESLEIRLPKINGRIAFLWILAFIAVSVGEGFLTNNPESFWLNAAKSIGSFTVFIVGWSLVWSLLTKVFSGQVRFLRHFVAALKALVLTQCVVWLLHALAFMFSIPSLAQFDSMIFIIMMGLLIITHLDIAMADIDDSSTPERITISERTDKFIRFGGTGLMLGALALTLALKFQTTGRFTDGLYLGSFMPPSWRLHAAQKPEVLEQGLASLKEKADAQAVKPGDEVDGEED